jgi:isocitrate dehydrogenase
VPERGAAHARQLAELGKLTLKPEANIIKLPNISASVAQLKEAIAELQGKGYPIPDFPENPRRRGKGHPRALQQVHRQRRQPGAARGQLRPPRAAAVKEYARKNPHSMAEWSQASRSTSRTCTTATSTMARSP